MCRISPQKTAERTRDATRRSPARSGGCGTAATLYGYDLNLDRKGYLVVNSDEAAAVNFAFKSYLDTGSIRDTVEALNRRGCRTKAYRSRRDIDHVGRPFTYFDHSASS